MTSREARRREALVRLSRGGPPPSRARRPVVRLAWVGLAVLLVLLVAEALR